MHKNHFLSNYIIKQFNVNKFKKMIKIFLSIVDNFRHTLEKVARDDNILDIFKKLFSNYKENY